MVVMAAVRAAVKHGRGDGEAEHVVSTVATDEAVATVVSAVEATLTVVVMAAATEAMAMVWWRW